MENLKNAIVYMIGSFSGMHEWLAYVFTPVLLSSGIFG